MPKITLEIVQTGYVAPYARFTNPGTTIHEDAQVFTLSIESGGTAGWSLSSDHAWLSPEKTDGSGDAEIEITAQSLATNDILRI